MTSTNTNPTDFSVADVLAWARTKPADERYRYTDPENCALCQFLRETGRAASPRVDPWTWRDGGHNAARFGLSDDLASALNGVEDTFGELVENLEALEPKSAWTRSDAYMNDLELARA